MLFFLQLALYVLVYTLHVHGRKVEKRRDPKQMYTRKYQRMGVVRLQRLGWVGARVASLSTRSAMNQKMHGHDEQSKRVPTCTCMHVATTSVRNVRYAM